MIKIDFKELKIGDEVIVECSPHYYPGNKLTKREGIVSYKNNNYVNVQFSAFGEKFNESFTKIDLDLKEVIIYAR